MSTAAIAPALNSDVFTICVGSSLTQEVFDIYFDSLSLNVPPLPGMFTAQAAPTRRNATIGEDESGGEYELPAEC